MCALKTIWGSNRGDDQESGSGMLVGMDCEAMMRQFGQRGLITKTLSGMPRNGGFVTGQVLELSAAQDWRYMCCRQVFADDGKVKSAASSAAPVGRVGKGWQGVKKDRWRRGVEKVVGGEVSRYSSLNIYGPVLEFHHRCRFWQDEQRPKTHPCDRASRRGGMTPPKNHVVCSPISARRSVAAHRLATHVTCPHHSTLSFLAPGIKLWPVLFSTGDDLSLYLCDRLMPFLESCRSRGQSSLKVLAC
nr:hypothetical protein CFP56_71877 [Quercus suber]